MLRYLNTFVLIGIALIGISLAGFATSNRFLTEPGQSPNPYSSLIYLGAGVLMLINGVVSARVTPPAPRPAESQGRQKTAEPTGSERVSS
jgi:hypothetical protein